jgi:hypothetical protein
MGVNSSGADKKFQIAQSEFARVMPLFIRDAAQWVALKLKDEIINGEGGTDYPKSYPGSISPGSEGFVGIISSNLRNSILPQRKDPYTWVIRQVAEAVAPYHDHVVQWSKDKYGKDFYEITLILYGPKVIRELGKVLIKYERAIEQKRRFTYSNPFPA